MKDFSGKMCPLFPIKDGEWPMYSYERPAWLFWNGFANRLLEKGYTEEHVKDVLQSRDIRHMLDIYQDEIEKMGMKICDDLFLDNNETPKLIK